MKKQNILRRLLGIAIVDSILAVYFDIFVYGQIYQKMALATVTLYDALVCSVTMAVIVATQNLQRDRPEVLLILSGLLNVLAIVSTNWICIGIYRGLIMGTFYGPINVIIGLNTHDEKISLKYQSKETLARKISGIISPVIMGYIITYTTNMYLIILLILVILQIVLVKNMVIKSQKQKHKTYYREFFAIISKNKKVLKTYFSICMNGFSGISSRTILVLMISLYGANAADMGTMSSILNCLSILGVMVASRFLPSSSKRARQIAITISGIISAIAVILVAIWPEGLTFWLYNIVSKLFVSILALLVQAKRFGMGEIAANYPVQHQALSEFALWLGRIMALAALWICSKLGNDDILSVTFLVLISAIALLAYALILASAEGSE